MELSGRWDFTDVSFLPQHVGQEGDVAGLLACGGEGDLP